jgi:hypothetical protein
LLIGFLSVVKILCQLRFFKFNQCLKRLPLFDFQKLPRNRGLPPVIAEFLGILQMACRGKGGNCGLSPFIDPIHYVLFSEKKIKMQNDADYELSKNECQSKIKEMIECGLSKEEVYNRLSRKGVTDKRLTSYIASYLSSNLLREHSGKIISVKLLLLLDIIFCLVTLFSIQNDWLRVSVMGAALIGFLFLAWMIWYDKAKGYNGYIGVRFLLLVYSTMLPENGLLYWIVNILLLFYLMYVRSKLFPDYILLNTIKKSWKL